ncbi:hypothetical protein PS639_00706 [Pseudomonas fluorescens]|nr:hypothetical protein PS639_00706 [Pseudomonas fluorescens]
MENGERSAIFWRETLLPDIGAIFGRFTVIGFTHYKDENCSRVKVQCSCGSHPQNASWRNLYDGKSTMCRTCAGNASGFARYPDEIGLIPDPKVRKRTRTRCYCAIRRCHSPSDESYHNYGARGIKVYELWRTDIYAFMDYLVTLNGWDQPLVELDRIDTDCGYEPGNLRFVSKSINQKNKRKAPEMQVRLDAQAKEIADLLAENEKLRASLVA